MLRNKCVWLLNSARKSPIFRNFEKTEKKFQAPQNFMKTCISTGNANSRPRWRRRYAAEHEYAGSTPGPKKRLRSPGAYVRSRPLRRRPNSAGRRQFSGGIFPVVCSARRYLMYFPRAANRVGRGDNPTGKVQALRRIWFQLRGVKHQIIF